MDGLEKALNEDGEEGEGRRVHQIGKFQIHEKGILNKIQ